MFEIDVPTKGKVYLNQKLAVLHEELNISSDPGFVKSNYRDHIERLVDRLDVDYDFDFWDEIRWIWNHLHELSLVGDMWISDFEYEQPRPIYKGFSDIGDQFEAYVDIYRPIDDINFPVDIYKSLYDEILKQKGRKVDHPDPSLRELNAVVVFDHKRAINTLKKVHRVSLTAYKQRIYLDALTVALSYTPNTKKNEPEVLVNNSAAKSINKDPVDRGSVINRMRELEENGYTDDQASKIVEKEINFRKSFSTIKKWYRNYN